MKIDKICREVSTLKDQVRALGDRVEAFESELLSGPLRIGRRLKGRGLDVYRRNPSERLLLPPGLSPELTSGFYERMKKYSFRLFLRDLLSVRSLFRPADLTRYCSNRIAEEYTRFLCQTAAVVLHRRDVYRFGRLEVSSFGPTLEWFVAEMFQREFDCPAIYGVRLKETDTGGDFDVLTLWENRLVYVEVKSSPPKSIEGPEIRAFLCRIYDLIPDVALFFNDTHLRMRDKVIQVFEGEAGKISERLGVVCPPQKLSDEIYHLDHWIYILNSKRDIVSNFSRCLRDHLRTSRNRWSVSVRGC